MQDAICYILQKFTARYSWFCVLFAILEHLFDSLSKNFVFRQPVFCAAKHRRPKVPIRKLSPSQSHKTEVHASGFLEFAKQILFYSRYRATTNNRNKYLRCQGKRGRKSSPPLLCLRVPCRQNVSFSTVYFAMLLKRWRALRTSSSESATASSVRLRVSSQYSFATLRSSRA